MRTRFQLPYDGKPSKVYNLIQDVPSSHYDIILSDPPWDYYGSPDKDQAAGKHYKLLSIDELVAMDLARPLKKRGIFFMWATCPRLDVAMELGARMGLHFKGVPFVWAKTSKDGKLIGARGVRPTIVKPVVELVLAFSRVRRGRPLPIISESVRQVVGAPTTIHSRKPPLHNKIRELFGPDVIQLEQFARSIQVGWDAFGDDVYT